MAVAFDAVGVSTTGKSATAATSVDLTDLTIGTGSNRALVIQVSFIGTADAGTAPTGISWTWDNGGTNQAMTQIGSTITGADGEIVQLWGLVNPTSGNKTLHGAWTNSQEVVVQAVSWMGVDQTGGATSFANFNSATGPGATTPATVDITSAANNFVMAVATGGKHVAIGSVTSNGETQTFLYHGSGSLEAGGNYKAGAATVTMQATYPGGESWAIAGVDIVAASGGGGPTTAQLIGIFDQATAPGMIGRVDA